jgi:hypothetical protein
MHNKDLKDYLQVLRAREARPPFSEIARLVANAPVRNATAIPLYAKFATTLAIGGIIAAGAWVFSANYHAPEMPHAGNPVNSGSSYQSQAPHQSYGSLAPKFVLTKSTKSNVANVTVSFDKRSAGSKAPLLHASNEDNPAQPIQPCPIRELTSAIPPIGSSMASTPLIGVPRSTMEAMGNIIITVGGAVGEQFSANAAYRQLSFSDAFLGVGYTFSQNACVRLLAGEEVFSVPSSVTTNSISFHDTTISSYQNVLGEIQSVDPPALMRVYWLGASYRYTIGDLSNAIRPFAEVMAGGSTDGFLTHQSIGAEFVASSNIDLDLLFEASELIPQNSGWLTKAGFSAAVSYCW